MRKIVKLLKWWLALTVTDAVYHALRNHGWNGRVHVSLAHIEWSALRPWLLASLVIIAIWAFWPRPYRLGKGWPRWSRPPIDLDSLLRMNPTQFEQAIAQLLSSMGYVKVRRVGQAGDLGVDVQCEDLCGNLVIVQCKRYAPGRSVSSSEMQSFIGMAYTHHGAQPGQAMFFTTSTFTKPAADLGNQHDIVMVDGQRLQHLISQPLDVYKDAPQPQTV